MHQFRLGFFIVVKVPEAEELNFKAPLNLSTNCLQCVNKDPSATHKKGL
jgi:hypothetical protein